MDKSTLSNYGWIVIAVLVLSVMIALATPFGHYIELGAKNTLFGLIGTSNNAMDAGFGDILNKEPEDPTNPTNKTDLEFGVMYENSDNPNEVFGVMFFENGDFLTFVNGVFGAGRTNSLTIDEENKTASVETLGEFTFDENSVTLGGMVLTKTNKTITFADRMKKDNEVSNSDNVLVYKHTYKTLDDPTLQAGDLLFEYYYYDTVFETYVFIAKSKIVGDTHTDYQEISEKNFGTFSNGMFVTNNEVKGILVIEDGKVVLHTWQTKYFEEEVPMEK